MFRIGRGLLVIAVGALLVMGTAVRAAGPADTQKAPSGRAWHQRVSCEEVIAKVDHNKSVEKGHPPSVIAVAKALGIRPFWVEQCMTAYGRRLPRKLEAESGESAHEDRIERFEEEEAEETASEDVEESDDKGDVESHEEKQPKVARPTPKPRDLIERQMEEY